MNYISRFGYSGIIPTANKRHIELPVFPLSNSSLIIKNFDCFSKNSSISLNSLATNSLGNMNRNHLKQ